MAHFAEIDAGGIVKRVIVVHDSVEAFGAEWCASMYGGNWVQTSYTGRVRKNFAGIGFAYDPVRDAFIPPNPGFASWVLDEESCQWKAPIPMPEDGNAWIWDEQEMSWKPVQY